MSKGICGWGVLLIGYHGVSQGPVLDPLLFVIQIDNLDNSSDNIVSKFAGDTKISGIIDSEGVYLSLP